MPFMMKSLSWMAFLLLLLRGIKYSVFAGVDILARLSWYLYYAPMLLLPLFLFYISLLISPGVDSHVPKRWYWVGAVTVVLILLVLTNDLHGLVSALIRDLKTGTAITRTPRCFTPSRRGSMAFIWRRYSSL